MMAPAGIAFSAEDNRGQLGGQVADNLLVTAYQPISPVTQETIVYLPDIRKDSGVDYGAMISIPAGNFQMGCSPNADSCAFDDPLHTVYLDAYAIDKYEVTNARYAKCVTAGGCTAPHVTSTVTHPSYYGNPAFDSFPVVGVDWNQATAFCAWEGRRLPTEAEWEKAARGSSDTRIYPWGGYTARLHAGEFRLRDCYRMRGRQLPGGFISLRTASPYGALDMAGNVYEWVNVLGFKKTIIAARRPGITQPVRRAVLAGCFGVERGPINTLPSVSPRVTIGRKRTTRANGGFRCARSP